jgi:hypothetical protein
MTDGMRAVRLLAAATEAFRNREATAPDDHLAHIRAGQVQAVAVSARRPALPREPTRVNDDLAAAADPVLKGQEAIRLRETE